MQILIMTGSLRAGSYSAALGRAAAQLLQDSGAAVDLCSPDDLVLPFCDARDDESTYPPEVAAWRERAARADGFLVISPEYHGGLSGLLKNALDLLDAEQFSGKPAALAVAAGGPKGGGAALVGMRTIFRGLLSLVIPEQMTVCDQDFNGQGELTSPQGRRRLEQLVRSLVRYSTALKMVPK